MRLFACSLLLAALATPSVAETRWALSLGVFDTGGASLRGEAGLELRLAPIKPLRGYTLSLVPAFGVSANEDGGAWLWGCLRYDWEVSERWVVTPYTGISLYEQGDGKDLGGIVEFRSGLEVSRRLAGGGRLGLSFYHLSNADLYDSNPGSNSLVLVWSPGRRAP